MMLPLRSRTRRARPGPDRGAHDGRPGRRAGGVLVGLGVDAPGRLDGQEHLRLAGPAVTGTWPGYPHARRDPGRGAGQAGRLGRHRTLADRPVGALDRVGADQADARQPGRGRLRLFAGRLPDRGRPRRRGGLRQPARPGLDAGHPAGQRHGAQPHGHRLALGRGPSRVVPVAPLPAVPGLHVHGRGPVVR